MLSASLALWLQLRAAEGNVGCFHQRQDFVAWHDFHFLDRARGNDRRDVADARLDDYFTEDFVGHNAFNSSRELVSDAFFHSGEDSPNEIGCQRQPAVENTRL